MHHDSDNVELNVSQASRRMAQPVQGVRGKEFPTARDERTWLVRRKAELQATITENFSRSAYTAAQRKIRGSGGGGTDRTLRDWMSLREVMDRDRAAIVREIKEIEDRLVRVNQLAKLESAEEHKRLVAADHKVESSIADEMLAVRLLLERLCEKFGA